MAKCPVKPNGRPLRRVKATLGEGIAPQYPPCCEHRALPEAKVLVCLDRVARASWDEAAGLWQQRRYPILVEPQHSQRCLNPKIVVLCTLRESATISGRMHRQVLRHSTYVAICIPAINCIKVVPCHYTGCLLTPCCPGCRVYLRYQERCRGEVACASLTFSNC